MFSVQPDTTLVTSPLQAGTHRVYVGLLVVVVLDILHGDATVVRPRLSVRVGVI